MFLLPRSIVGSCLIIALALTGCGKDIDEEIDEPTLSERDAGDAEDIEEVQDSDDLDIKDEEEDSDTTDSSDGGEDVAPGTEDFVPGDPATGSGPISIGTGRDEFIPLLQGDEVRWEAGIQGGHHIWVTFELSEESSGELDDEIRGAVRHRYRIEDASGTLLAQASRVGGVQDIDGVWTGVGMYAVLEAPRRPGRMNGELMRYEVEVEIEGFPLYHRQLWVKSQCCD